MAKIFDIQHFFRRSPRDWLKRYFDQDGLLKDFDWSALGRRDIEPLMHRWTAFDQTTRSRHVEDFRAISALATPSCKVQIIDEAGHHGQKAMVAPKLLELGDFYACAFWLRLDMPALWEGALRFATADGKSKKYWRKRINTPRLGRKPTRNDELALARSLSNLFKRNEARGENCVVHSYLRGEDGRRAYYFAYPEDHRHTPLVYRSGELVPQAHNPAFEVIFIHDDEERTLNIWHAGDKERILDLQLAFAEAVLGAKIARYSPKDERAYHLQWFLDSDFGFHPDPVLGIEDVELRKLRVRVPGQNGYTILVDLFTDTPSHEIHSVLQKVLAEIPASQCEVTMVGLRVTFDQLPGEKDKRTRSFQITKPNSCNLKIDQFSPLIERLLVDHGIEPRNRAGISHDPRG